MRERETAPMRRALARARTEAQARAHWRTVERDLRQRTPPIGHLVPAQEAPAQEPTAPEALRHPPPIAHPQAEEPVLQPTGVVATCRRPATVPVRPLRDRRLEPAALHPAAVPSAAAMHPPRGVPVRVVRPVAVAVGVGSVVVVVEAAEVDAVAAVDVVVDVVDEHLMNTERTI